MASEIPQWKRDLFRLRTSDLEARGAAHAVGRPMHPVDYSTSAPDDRSGDLEPLVDQLLEWDDEING